MICAFVTGVHAGALLFFFGKQKTAYEMRISDWSSDVCSSDLRSRAIVRSARFLQRQIAPLPRPAGCVCQDDDRRLKPLGAVHGHDPQIGRASCRERVCQYVSISVVPVSLTKTN